ncbi:uncharacterized protein [Battus philenor]|uniref:uncharacterized protein isoform X1 n=1 Tax=Battus philenor TaxID=42288 RepID=UPI0035D0D8CC
MGYLQHIAIIALFGYARASVVVNVFDAIENNGLETISDENTLNGCNPQTCSAICHMLGFNKGTCNGDVCDCTYRLQAKDINTLRRVKSLTDCSPLGCDQSCRRIGFPGGVCVNGRCKCDILKKDSEVSNEERSLKDCSPLGCDQTCRRIGFPGGVCVNGKCKCDILRNFKDNDSSNEVTSVNDRSLKDCSPLGCDQTCRRIGFPGGVCVNDKCKCDIMKKLKDDENEISEDVKACNFSICNMMCIQMHNHGGMCLGDQCKCF